MIKACIFDLDGTLADTLESIARAVNRGLEHFGYEGRPVEEYNYYAGDGLNAAWQRALKRAGGVQGEYLEKGIPLVRSYLAQEPLYHVKPYPGIEEALEKMKRLAIAMGVLSNKPHRQAVQVVESLFGTECFDYIQGQTEEILPKPDLSGIRRVLEKLDVHPEECLYVGDTNTDMLTGGRAGLYTVGVAWGFRQPKELEDSGARAIIHEPGELLDFITGELYSRAYVFAK